MKACSIPNNITKPFFNHVDLKSLNEKTCGGKKSSRIKLGQHTAHGY